MTPAEVAAKLRAFNEWRRGDEDIPQPDPRVIGEAIDAAVEMIDRLEAAEKSDAESIAMRRKARDERDALRTKIEQMEKQVPVAWWGRGPHDGRIEFSAHKPAPFVMRDFAVTPLYALPGAQPAPSVPEGWTLVPIEPTPTMVKAGLESSHVEHVHRVLACYDAMIDAAPEAKP